MFVAFSTKNISVVVAGMICPSVIEPSMFFSSHKYSFMYKVFNHHFVKSKE